MTGVQFWEPKSLEEAVALMHAHAPDAVPLAGGTDLVVHSRSAKRELPQKLIHLRLIEELAYALREVWDGLGLPRETNVVPISSLALLRPAA